MAKRLTCTVNVQINKTSHSAECFGNTYQELCNDAVEKIQIILGKLSKDDLFTWFINQQKTNNVSCKNSVPHETCEAVLLGEKVIDEYLRKNNLE